MVNMDKVQRRVLRGLYAGAGAVATGAVGNTLSNALDNDLAVAGGEILLGATLSVGVDEIFQSPSSVPNEALEYAGYGIQAVGWDEAFESFSLNLGGQSRVVNVEEVEESSASQNSQPSAVTVGGY